MSHDTPTPVHPHGPGALSVRTQVNDGATTAGHPPTSSPAPTRTTTPSSSGSGNGSGSGNAAVRQKPMMQLNRTADEARRNALNMEKMVKKNVLASARPGSLKRGLAVVEYFKNRQQQGQEEAAQASPGPLLKKKRDSPAMGGTTIAHQPLVEMPERATKPLLVGKNGGALHTLKPGYSLGVTQRNGTESHRASVSSSSSASAAPHTQIAAKEPQQPRTSPVAPPSAPTASVPSANAPPADRMVERATVVAHEVPGPLHSTAPKLAPKSPFQSFHTKFGQSKNKDGTWRSPVRNTAMPVRSAPQMPSLPTDDHESAPKTTLPPRTPPANADTTTNSTIEAVESRSSDKPVVDVDEKANKSQSQPTAIQKDAAVPKSARALFAAPKAVATKSMCYSTDGIVTSLDVSPDGECIVAALSDGSVRLFEMDSTVPSDRHGYLLGHIDEECNQSMANASLRVKITSDGRNVFVGCRSGPRVVMTINLHGYRNGKDGDEEMDDLQKHFHSHSRLRGFADVTPAVAPAGKVGETQSYYFVCGLGVGNLHLWRYIERASAEPDWVHMCTVNSGSNTAIMAAFAPQGAKLSLCAIAEGRNLRMWTLEHENPDAEDSVHVVKGHVDIRNTKDVVSVHGTFAYGISASGEAYRFSILDPNVRKYFETEQIYHGNAAYKSRRSTIMLESIAASDNGTAVVAISDEGILYYAKDVDENPSNTTMLKVIGRNASRDSHFKSSMKVYHPAVANGLETQPMMAVVTNPQSDQDVSAGFFNVDPIDAVAARWMKPSRSGNCWVCGVRNLCHWQCPPEQQRANDLKRSAPVIEIDNSSPSAVSETPTRKTARRTQAVQSESRAGVASQGFNERPERLSATQAKDAIKSEAAAYLKKMERKAKAKTSASEAAVATAGTPTKPVQSPAKPVAATSTPVTPGSASSDDQNLAQELERYKERYNQIVSEWKRRLTGERQMRRLWKNREAEFNQQLDDALSQLDTALSEVTELRELQKDTEKRYACEKLKAEQQDSVKQRYERLCERMQDKMLQLDEQKRVLEQTTRALLQEVERNVNAAKNTDYVDKSECILCKDKQAVMAVVPCGHLCFCEEDGEVYRRKSPVNVVCPICQRESISLLRIY
ncbi:TPA: hypothetical protein N0F65_009805 [Lagenidium giganteum]|uniref:RING-type domain-containing protein n=1 Tax=Lagenidium giganteum TaxID=4803 RepID=A0AAV2YHU8_9STRA|nr:TPA: hypothetical protein N0F65_009805 [Lagenidium giganteum]